jgi:uncharacterized membrane protein YphA (DoxX/SURF4 family)
VSRIVGLSGLALRQGLALVLFAWGYDFYFNPHYYTRLFAELPGGAALVPAATVVQLGLAALLTVGLATRPVALGAAALFAAFGVLQLGHQPIGLPQNAALVGASIALFLVGPGQLSLPRSAAAPSEDRLRWASAGVRAGLALSFLIYGVEKFTQMLEYRIVVAEAPLLAPLVATLGVDNAVAAAGAFEILCGLALLMPGLVVWGALGQAALLVVLLAAFGYPFSYPQDLGLLAAVGAAVLLQRSAVATEAERDEATGTTTRIPRETARPLPRPVLDNDKESECTASSSPVSRHTRRPSSARRRGRTSSAKPA